MEWLSDDQMIDLVGVWWIDEMELPSDLDADLNIECANDFLADRYPALSVTGYRFDRVTGGAFWTIAANHS